MTDSIPSTPTYKTLALKMSKVLGEVKRVSKNGTNTFQNYKYTTESDALDAIRPLLAAHKIAVFFDCLSVEEFDNNRIRVQCQIELVCGDTGESRSSIIYGEARDADKQGRTQDKGLYKAMTGAMKYWLFKTFLMSTGDDVESDAGNDPSTHTAPSSRAPRRSASPANPAKENPVAVQVRALATYATNHGMTADDVRKLCRDNGLPERADDFATAEQAASFEVILQQHLQALQSVA